jgi:formamidopyrimidine-DNA glycosylase
MMPELPEVETLCRQLNAVLAGQRIVRIEVLDPRLGAPKKRYGDPLLSHFAVADSDPENIMTLVGRRVSAVTRKGKSIRFELGDGLTAALHLRMTGRLLYRKDDMTPLSNFVPHSRMVIGFSSGMLVLIDPRRFATFDVRPAGISPLLSDDPMEGLPVRRLREIAGTRRLPVKAFLMDQRIIAGIGNIYACEILFVAGIDPRRPACSLTATEWRRVAKATPAILRRAVTCRGTTVSDWRDLFGRSGTNQDHLEVYLRKGKPCRRCGGIIERIAQGGRGTWMCPMCQR